MSHCCRDRCYNLWCNRCDKYFFGHLRASVNRKSRCGFYYCSSISSSNKPANTDSAKLHSGADVYTIPNGHRHASTSSHIYRGFYPCYGRGLYPKQPPPQTGIVVDVVDGDTIKVLLDADGRTYSVRYIGMDTPENTSQVEYFGPEATAKNSELVYGKTVILIKDVSETDRYGRLLRYVIAGNVFINYELVAQGYANTASYPPDIACIPTFQVVEQQASAAKLGLWGAPPTQAIVLPLPTASSGGLSSGSGGIAPCNCSGPDLDCKDFKTHNAAQACYEHCIALGYGNIFRLDGNDNDGLACESLP